MLCIKHILMNKNFRFKAFLNKKCSSVYDNKHI